MSDAPGALIDGIISGVNAPGRRARVVTGRRRLDAVAAIQNHHQELQE